MLFVSLFILLIVIVAAVIIFLHVFMSRSVTNATSHLDELNEEYTYKMEEAKKRLAAAEKYYDETILKAKIDSEKAKLQIMKEARESEELLISQSRKHSEDILAQANRAREALLKEIDVRIQHASIEKA